MPAVAGPPGAVTPAEGDPGFARILLATEGRSIPDAAIERVAELADRQGPQRASVRVLSIARVHGVAFGLPNPGLLPTKQELSEQNEIVASAIKRLKRKGLPASGRVLGTRKATARICEEATRHECQAIVMSADRDRNRLVADMMWSQEPQRVRRRARVPVFLVVQEP
ncbi:MAG TPA: universal stress protein [Solirubrobacteraceae bacterium]|nr:universal stress protein [Solirubrobacteraceae bacterium]